MVTIKHPAPAFGAEQAAAIAAELYGVRGALRPLPGEHDQNFRLTTPAGEEFVLKVSHAAEDPALLDLQRAMLARLADRAPALALPRPLPTRDGRPVGTTTAPDGTRHLVRLLTYVPGALLAETRPHPPELLRSLGALLGTLDRALEGFAHPAARRELKWDLARAGWVRDYLGHVEPPARRAIVERFMARYEDEAVPALASLPAGVIHGDANDYNVLVAAAPAPSVGASGGRPPAGGQPRAVGLIDFGDAVHTATVCELAIGAAYAMLGKPDPLAAAVRVVAGYHAARPLSDAELAALYPLIGARLCISVTNSAYQRRVDPANAYLLISEAPAWALLERLSAIPPRLAHCALRAACGLPASPAAPAVARWLADHAAALGPLSEPDPRAAPALAFDLGVGSRDLGNWPELADPVALAHNLGDQLRAAGAALGVGRYAEARPIHTDDRHRVAGNDGPEWRTVHLGLDLFLPPGAPVLAPLDGVVRAVLHPADAPEHGPALLLEHTVAAGDASLTFCALYGRLDPRLPDGLRPGVPVARGDRLGAVGDAAVSGALPPHLHLQLLAAPLDDLLDDPAALPAVVRPSERALWLDLCPDPTPFAGLAPARPPSDIPADGGRGVDELLAARRAHLGPNLSVSYRRPLKILRGYMQRLYDADGQPYLDAVNNVAHVGHNHPRVVRAGQRQMAVLNTNTRYLHDDLVRYAERLTATLPEPLRVCYFVCSGSEANELALRLARVHTRRRDVVVVDVAYHGNTTALVEISPYKYDGPGGAGPAPYVHKVPMPDPYRGAHRSDDPRAGERYAAHVAEAARQAHAAGDGPAAFICESALGCGGQIILPPGYLAAAYAHVRAAGGVCIADEVQTGFGRVGSHFWAFETQGVVPDIVTLGKPIGNGHPLGAVVTTPEIAASFDNGMEYFNTFGGNPVSCAIGLAVLDVIRDEGLQEHARATGARLMDGLRALMPRYPLIGDVRGLGLFVGVELVRDREARSPAAAQAAYVANRMRERGVLLSTDGPDHNVLKIKPPLVFDAADADLLLATLDAVLQEDAAQP